jgi:hypothetical protein
MTDSLFEDFPQDMMKEVGRLVDALLGFGQKYDWVGGEAQQDPKNTYIKLAREWDGLDLIDTQEKIAAARQAVALLTGDE